MKNWLKEEVLPVFIGVLIIFCVMLFIALINIRHDNSIRSEVAAEYDQQAEDAAASSYEEGYNDGYADGYAAAQAELQ